MFLLDHDFRLENQGFSGSAIKDRMYSNTRKNKVYQPRRVKSAGVVLKKIGRQILIDLFSSEFGSRLQFIGFSPA